MQVVVNNILFGIPSSRTRRITTISKSKRFIVPDMQGPNGISKFYRTLCLDGDVFFCAPDEEVMVAHRYVIPLSDSPHLFKSDYILMVLEGMVLEGRPINRGPI